MKCEICNLKIKTTFLNKMIGTVIKDSKGKKRSICHECQRKYKSKDEMLEKIK